MEEKTAVELFDMKVAHIGINGADEADSASLAKQFEDLMGLKTRETPASYFSGELVEIMKKNGRGAKGHIGFSVNNCEAALAYYEARGVHAIEGSKKFREDGTCYFAYLDVEIGGFAVHLVEE